MSSRCVRPQPRAFSARACVPSARPLRQARCSSQATPSAADTATLEQMKKKLYSMVGEKGGLDMAASQKLEVIDYLKEFEGKGVANPETQDLTGTTWKLLFTESEGSSSGKFGPIIGTTGQFFPKDRPGQYINSVDLFNGGLRMELLGNYRAVPENKIELEFKSVQAFLVSFPVLTKAFPENFIGFWKMVYADDGLRIFYTNKGNIFAMYNEEAGKQVYTNWSRFDKTKFE